MMVFSLARAGDGYRQLNECSHQLSVNFLAPLRRSSTWRIEEQRPVDRAFTRYCTETQEIRKERYGSCLRSIDSGGESESGHIDRQRRQTQAV
jgi:hypothetical protein